MIGHTPGPWEVVEHSWSRTGIYSSGGVGIAALDISDEATEETQQVWERAMSANARLMAAAPDLLKALEDFSEYAHAKECETDGPVKYSHGEITGLAYAARAAIAKAKGATA